MLFLGDIVMDLAVARDSYLHKCAVRSAEIASEESDSGALLLGMPPANNGARVPVLMFDRW